MIVTKYFVSPAVAYLCLCTRATEGQIVSLSSKAGSNLVLVISCGVRGQGF